VDYTALNFARPLHQLDNYDENPRT
jgi:hypothetical protein